VGTDERLLHDASRGEHELTEAAAVQQRSRNQAREMAESASTLGGAVVQVADLHVELTRQRTSLHVLRGIDLDIAYGEILGLAGESGSGKSVLGLTLLGLLPEQSHPVVRGSVVVDGTDVTTAPAAVLRDLRQHRLGAIFQDPMTSLDPTMRIGKQMLEVAASAAQSISLLKEVGVPDPVRRLNAYPHELSGGLRQRVMIAIAIAQEPRLIVADEPTTALDVTVQAQILELFARLRRDHGCSIVLITHDLAVASQIADRVAVLYAGRIAEIGPTEDLLGRPQHPYTAALMRSRLNAEADKRYRLPTLAGEPPDPREFPPGCPFAPRCAFAVSRCEASLPPLHMRGRHGNACLRGDEIDVRLAAASGQAWPSAPFIDPTVSIVSARSVQVAAPSSGVFRKKSGALILNGIDLTINDGESLALVGESGCGKTTFLRTVAALTAASGGSLEVDDAAPQMIFQDAGSSLTPWLSVGEIVGERLHGQGLTREQRRARVESALAVVGLPPRAASVRPTQLSGGQRQRAAIARAVIVPPRILLCDEPTSALDVSIAAGVLNLLGELRRQFKMALLFVTHDLSVARVIADRIAVMYLGRVVEIGPADTILTSPVHPYTCSLIASIPRPGGARAELAGEPPSLFDPPSGCAFHPRCPSAREGCSIRSPKVVRVDATGHLVDCVLAEDV
jgi:peptide/nickel transport system ATP-binding protein